MSLLRKVQTSNLLYRKFIFWIIIIILTIILGILFFKNSGDTLQNIFNNPLNIEQKIKELWPEEIEQKMKKEFNNFKEILNIINQSIKQGEPN
jgi:uncharacterized protein YacL